jgi:hypothetical protein
MKVNRPVLALMGSLLLLFCISRIETPAVEESALEFTLACEKDTFLVGEPIWIDIRMRNLGEEAAAVKPLTPASDWFRFVVLDAQNDTLEPQGKEDIEWVGGGPTFTVLPDDTLYICRNLLEATGPGTSETFVSGRTYLDPGSYRVSAVYGPGIASNEVRFIVVEPRGDERLALDLWRDGYQSRRQKEIKEAMAKWKSLLHNRSESVYAPSACWALATTYDVFAQEPTKAALYEKKLISDYPNSGFCQYALGAFTRDKDPEEREQILRELEAQYAGTRAGKFARNMRRKIYAY